MANAKQDGINDQKIIIASMSRESLLQLFRAKQQYRTKEELARVLECTPEDAEETLLERIESLISQICEITGELSDEVYHSLEIEALDSL